MPVVSQESGGATGSADRSGTSLSSTPRPTALLDSVLQAYSMHWPVGRDSQAPADRCGLAQLETVLWQSLGDKAAWVSERESVTAHVSAWLDTCESAFVAFKSTDDLTPADQAQALAEGRMILATLLAVVSVVEGDEPAHPLLALRAEIERLRELAVKAGRDGVGTIASLDKVEADLVEEQARSTLGASIGERDVGAFWRRRLGVERYQELLASQGESAGAVAELLSAESMRLTQEAEQRLRLATARDRDVGWCAAVDAMRREARRAETAAVGSPASEGIRRLETVGREIRALTATGKALAEAYPAEAGLARGLGRLGAAQRSVERRLDDLYLRHRREKLLGRRGVRVFDTVVMAIVIALGVGLSIELWLDFSDRLLPGPKAWFARLDLAACLVLLVDYASRVALARRRLSYVARTLWVELLPALPIEFGAHWLAGRGTAELGTTLGTLARWFLGALPWLRLARMAALASRVGDLFMGLLAPWLNTDVVLFEPSPREEEESRARYRIEALRRAGAQKWSEVSTRLQPRDLDLLVSRLRDVLSSIQKVGGFQGWCPPPEAVSARVVSFDAAVDRLIESTPADVAERYGPRFCGAVHRFAGAFDLPVIRRFPVVRDWLAARSRGPSEAACALLNLIGVGAQRVLDLVYSVADFQATLTAPLFLDRVGDRLVTWTSRPVRNLLLFGSAFVLLTLLLEGFGGLLRGLVPAHVDGWERATLQALVREGYRSRYQGWPDATAMAGLTDTIVSKLPSDGLAELDRQSRGRPPFRDIAPESADALLREGFASLYGHEASDSELRGLGTGEALSLIPKGLVAIEARAGELDAVEVPTLRALFSEPPMLRGFLRSVRSRLGWPFIALALGCWGLLTLGSWLRKIASRASESSQRVVEAQFGSQTKAQKRLHQAEDLRFLGERVLGPELTLRADDDLAPEAGGTSLEEVDGVALGLTGSVTVRTDEAGFLRNLNLLYRDYMDGSPFHRSDTKTTTQLIGNLALANLRRSHLTHQARHAKRLDRLDLNRSRGVFRGPSLWFDSITRRVVQETARLLLDYNRHAIPWVRLACSSNEVRERYREWLAKRLDLPTMGVELPDRVGSLETTDREDHGAKRREIDEEFFETVEFSALDFLADDGRRDADIAARYGRQLALLLRLDRRRNVRRAFRSYPLHRVPLESRTFNPLVAYDRELARGRWLLAPVRLAGWLAGAAARLPRRLFQATREVLRPSVPVEVDEREDRFGVALRKIHRMRKPAFMESLWLRAEFDIEYLGLSLPTMPRVESSELSESAIDLDLDFIGATRRDRMKGEELRASHKERLIWIGRWLRRLGWDYDHLTPVLLGRLPHLADRRGEAIRSLATACLIDYDDLFSLGASMSAVERMLAYASDPAFDPARLPEGMPPALSDRRLSWYPALGDVAVERILDRPWSPRFDLETRERILQYLARHRTVVRPWAEVILGQGGDNPWATFERRLWEVLLRSDLWSEQLLVLRAIQSLTLLDVHHYGRMVWELGGFQDHEPDEPGIRLPFRPVATSGGQ